MEGASTPRGAETIVGILAALAIEQIAEGSILAFTNANPLTRRAWYVMLILVGLGIMAMAVQFFHGNATYLAARYKRWDPDEVPTRAWVATPFRHMVDVSTHVLEYSTLLGAGYFLAHDSTFHKACIWVVVLFGIDVVWLGLSWIVDATESSTPPPLRRTQTKWLWSDIATLIALVMLLVLADGIWFSALFALVLWASTVLEYGLNYHHYFAAGKAVDSVSAEVASTAEQYLATLLGAQFGPNGKGSLRDDLKSELSALFAFFMANAQNRRLLFHRRAARLHVGLYAEHEGKLWPVFRYVDPPINENLKNRAFRIGEGYIGQAFLVGRDEPKWYVVTHDEPLEGSIVLIDRDTGQVDERAKFYQSSIITNLYWPNTNAAFGTLLVTASEPHYFTPAVHEAMLIGLSKYVSRRLSERCGAANPTEASAKLVKEIAKDPIIVPDVPKAAASGAATPAEANAIIVEDGGEDPIEGPQRAAK